MFVVYQDVAVNLNLVTSFKKYIQEDYYIIFNVQTLHEDDMEYFVRMKFFSSSQCEKNFQRILKSYDMDDRVLYLD